MKKNNILYAVAALLFVTAFLPFAAFADEDDLKDEETVEEKEKQQKKIAMPGKSEVMVIGRITVKYDEDMQFYAKTRAVKEENLSKGNTYLIPVREDASDKEINNFADDQRNLYNDGDFFIATYKIPKDRNLKFDGTKFYFFSDKKTMIFLPLDFNFDVPEDTNYVYIGSFEYTVTGSDFMIKNAKVNDEFDQGQEIVNNLKSKNPIQLSRVALKENTEEEEKK